MNRSYLKAIYLVLSFTGLLLFLFYGASQVLAFFQSGANQKEMLVLSSSSINDYYQPKITWLNVGENKGRKTEQGVLDQVAKDYIASYYYQYKAFNTGNELTLNDHFTEKARVHLTSLMKVYEKENQSIRGTSVEHFTEVEFYAADGTIMTLRDSVVTYEKITASNGTDFTKYDTSTYRVMLLLEDNYWRIRHKVAIKDPEQYTIKADSVVKPVFTIKDEVILKEGEPFEIKAMNYYPEDHPWEEMWSHFDSSQFTTDFALIKSLNFNAIRIFVPFGDFGGAQVKPERLQQLDELLTIADQHDLKVILTLFDFFLGYRLEEWTLSDRHMEAVVTSTYQHPAILCYDLKNEPDLDFANHGEQEVMEWARFVAKRFKRYAPNALVTIGWSQPEHLMRLEDDLDILSYHFYRAPSELQTFIAETPIPSKPILLGETGKHTFSNWWYPFGSDEDAQEQYYQEVLETASTISNHYAVWTLYDFQHIPSNVAGKYPWQKGPQKAYGLINRKGERKPATELLRKLNKKKNSHEKES